MTVKLRNAQPEDAADIAMIYNEGICGRQATFETRERSAAEVLGWFETLTHPFIAAERDGRVVGWARASNYRARECYAGIAEYSVYVAQEAHGQGVGKALMLEFLRSCEAAGFWKVLSRIFPENTASLALCRAVGFREVGVYHKHAKLDGVWRDVVVVEYLIAANLR
jgi:phosphinothricin acetyltransferase